LAAAKRELSGRNASKREERRGRTDGRVGLDVFFGRIATVVGSERRFPLLELLLERLVHR
jgi:hypothetical protein